MAARDGSACGRVQLKSDQHTTQAGVNHCITWQLLERTHGDLSYNRPPLRSHFHSIKQHSIEVNYHVYLVLVGYNCRELWRRK